MKKFIKISLITSVIVLFLGIIVFIIGTIGGGNKDVKNMTENGELSFFDDHLRINPFFTGDGFLEVGWLDKDSSSGNKVMEAPDAPDAPDAPEAPTVSGASAKPSKSSPSKPAQTSAVMEGKGEVNILAEEVEKIEIALGAGQLYIETGDVENIQVITDCEDEFEVYVKNNTFYVEGFGWESNFLELTDWSEDRNVARIVIPSDLAFEETDMALGAGFLQFKNIILGETGMEVGAGEVDCQNTEFAHLSAEVGAGVIRMDNIKAGKTELVVAMGDAIVSGLFSDDIDIECSMGKTEVIVDGVAEDFDYMVEAAMGSVEIDGEKYDGLASEKKVDNGADKTISAEAAMGDIEISFTK